jgi:hypothetical protein
MTYDHWKSTNPADEFLGPEPESEDDHEPMTSKEIADLVRRAEAFLASLGTDRKMSDVARNSEPYRGDYLVKDLADALEHQAREIASLRHTIADLYTERDQPDL